MVPNKPTAKLQCKDCLKSTLEFTNKTNTAFSDHFLIITPSIFRGSRDLDHIRIGILIFPRLTFFITLEKVFLIWLDLKIPVWNGLGLLGLNYCRFIRMNLLGWNWLQPKGWQDSAHCPIRESMDLTSFTRLKEVWPCRHPASAKWFDQDFQPWLA